MKTQIIQLNQNDDAISVQDKMSWSQSERILLVWPPEKAVLSRKIDLNLLDRFASSMGAQLGLVTFDSAVRYYARQLGIPVFNNLRLAQNEVWKVTQYARINLHQKSHQDNLQDLRKNLHPPSTTRIEHPVIRFISFGISVLALLVLVIFIFPSAKIILSPRVEIQSMRFDLSADPSATSINLSTGLLPSYSKEVIVEARDTITSTGSMLFPNYPALGMLKFTNISKQAINIPAGTVVATQSIDPIRFITTTNADFALEPNKSILIPAQAIKSGSSGNLPPNKLVNIEGDLNIDLMVTNPSATQGGTDATFPTPTKQDFQILHDRIYSQLRKAALTELQTNLPEEDIVITPTLSMIETLTDTSIPSLGEPGNQLELTMRLRYQIRVVSGEELRSLVTPILDSRTPNGYSPVMNSLVIIQLNQPSIGQDGIVHLTVSAARRLKVVIQPYQAIEVVKGVTITKAKQNLFMSLPLMGQVQIDIDPTWWPRLPFVPMRIQVSQPEIP